MNQVAQRYARALFSLSVEAKKVDLVRQEINRLSLLAKSSPQLNTFMAAKRFGRKAHADALEQWATKEKVSPLLQRFLTFVCMHGRAEHLGQIAQAFESLACQAENQMRAQVTSAVSLTKDQQKLVTEALAHAFKKEIFLDQAVDEHLLGGMTIRTGSMLIDGSLKSKLAQLQQVMREG